VNNQPQPAPTPAKTMQMPVFQQRPADPPKPIPAPVIKRELTEAQHQKVIDALEKKNGYGETPLHTAVNASRNISKLATLYSDYELIDAKDHDGLTALHYATIKDDKKTAQVLLERFANPSEMTFAESLTPSDMAKSNEMKTLLTRGGVAQEQQRQEFDADVKNQNTPFKATQLDLTVKMQKPSFSAPTVRQAPRPPVVGVRRGGHSL
jgi:hypothetical protein